MNITRLIYWLTLVIAFQIHAEYAQAQQAFWKQTSLGALAGLRVYDLTFDSNGSIYVACTQPFAPQFGIYRSIDAGASWTLTGLHFTSDGTYYLMDSYRSLEVAPNGHLFALNPHDNGVYRSTDNGNNWTRVIAITYVRGLAVNSSGFVFLSSSIGIYLSTDDGSTWSEVNNGLGNINVYSLTISSNGVIFAGTAAGTYRSTNNGTTWTGGGNVSVHSIATDPKSQNLFAGTSSGVYRSSDSGQNWTSVGFPNQNVPAVQTSSIGEVFATPYEVIRGVSGQPVYRSSDNGVSWTKVIDGNFISLAYSSTLGIFAGTDGGLFRSTDNGNTWVHPNLSSGSISSLTAKPDGAFFAATLGNYVFRTTNAGSSWIQLINGLTNSLDVAVAVNSSGYVFIGTDSSGIFRSADDGQSWNNTSTGIGTNSHVFAFAIDSRGRMLAGCNSTSAGGVYASSNNGDQWTALTSTTGNVYSLISGPGGKIFAGTKDGKVYISTDTGATWANSKLTSSTVRSLAITPGGSIFAGTDYPGGLYQSTDNGITWSNIGFTNISVTSIIVKSTSNMFLGTYGQGAYRSTNNGVSWTQVNDGLKEYNVYSLAFDVAGYLYVGTESSGIFRSSQPIVTSVYDVVSAVPTEFRLIQNYPNPFNPTTMIRFEVPTRSRVTLKVYDVLGQEVAELVDEEKQPGTDEVRFDASHLPSGTYFYRLQAGEFAETKKLILLR